jgi:hypothetical protein
MLKRRGNARPTYISYAPNGMDYELNRNLYFDADFSRHLDNIRCA